MLVDLELRKVFESHSQCFSLLHTIIIMFRISIFVFFILFMLRIYTLSGLQRRIQNAVKYHVSLSSNAKVSPRPRSGLGWHPANRQPLIFVLFFFFYQERNLLKLEASNARSGLINTLFFFIMNFLLLLIMINTLFFSKPPNPSNPR